MMKKFTILCLAFFVLGCYLWYQEGERLQKAQTLIWAAYDGDLTGVKNALEDGSGTAWVMYIDDPAKDYRQAAMTPLLAAAAGGNEKILRYLIKQGEAPNQTNEQGWTPLFVAIRDGHAEAAAQLVLLGADPNLPTDNGATPLIMTVLSPFPTEKQRLSLLEYLLKKEADVNAYTKWNTDALYYALTTGKNTEAAKLLLQYGADPCRTYKGKNLLEIARQNPTQKTMLSVLKKARSKCRGPVKDTSR